MAFSFRSVWHQPAVIDYNTDANPLPSAKRVLHGGLSVGDSKVFAALLDNSGGTQKIHMYEVDSQNPCEWTKMDEANAPVVHKTAKLTSLVNTAGVGSTIWVLYVDNATGNLAVKSFNRSTHVWGAATVSSINMSGLSAPFGYWNDPKTAMFLAYEDPPSVAFVEQRSTGDLVVIYPYAKSSSSTLGARLGMKAVVFSAGAWGSPFVIGADASPVYSFPVTTLVGAGDRVHVFFIDESMHLFHQTIGPSGVYGIQQLKHPDDNIYDTLHRYKVADWSVSELVGRGCFDGTNIAIPYFLGQSNSDQHPTTQIWAAASADDPTWTYGNPLNLPLGGPPDSIVERNYAASMLPRNRMCLVSAAGVIRQVWLAKAWRNANWNFESPLQYATTLWIYPVDRCLTGGLTHNVTYRFYQETPHRQPSVPHPALSDITYSWDLNTVNNGSIVQMMWTSGQGFASRQIHYWELDTVITSCAGPVLPPGPVDKCCPVVASLKASDYPAMLVPYGQWTGPFEYNGKVYEVMGPEQWRGLRYIQVMAADIGSVEFVEKDAAHRPATYQIVGTYYPGSGSVFYVACPNLSGTAYGGAIHLYSFDMATELWSTSLGSYAIANFGNDLYLSRSGSTFLIYFEDSATLFSYVAKIGTSDPAVKIDQATTERVTPYSLMVDSTGLAHFRWMFNTASGVFYTRTWNPTTGALGTVRSFS